jgi:hypothetical protein
MRPEDANALKYKKAVEQRLEAVAHLVGGSDVGLACGTATMSAAHGETPRGEVSQSLDNIVLSFKYKVNRTPLPLPLNSVGGDKKKSTALGRAE